MCPASPPQRFPGGLEKALSTKQHGAVTGITDVELGFMHDTGGGVSTFNLILSTCSAEGVWGRCTVKTGKVLVVSEDGGDLSSYRATLTALGYSVELCSSYEGGARRIEGGEFDLVVLSQGSPAFEGRCVLEHNAELNPHIPVLVVARCLDIHCYLEAMELGAVDYLESPEPRDIEWVLEAQVGPPKGTLAA